MTKTLLEIRWRARISPWGSLTSMCMSSHRYTNKYLKRFLSLNTTWCCAALEWALYLCFYSFSLWKVCTSKGWLPGPLCVRRELPGGFWVEALWNVSRTTRGESYKQESEKFLVDKKVERIVFCLGLSNCRLSKGHQSLHPQETLYMKPYGWQSSLLKHHHFRLSFSPTLLFSFHSSVTLHTWLLGTAV